MARVRSAIRITESIQPPQEIKAKKRYMNDLELDENARVVTRAGIPIELTRREFDLLLFLMDHPNQVLTREQLLNKVWGFDYIGETNVVDVYVGYLRKKVEINFSYPLIYTVRGIGFMMKGSENDD